LGALPTKYPKPNKARGERARKRTSQGANWQKGEKARHPPDSDGGRMSAARRCPALSVFPELKVANFALLLSVRRIKNKINVKVIPKPL